jgi:hypothetical protein
VNQSVPCYVLKLNAIDELLNAPDVNSFAENEINILGEAALPHAARQMLARRFCHWHVARLVIQVPPIRSRPICRAGAGLPVTGNLIKDDEQAMRVIMPLRPSSRPAGTAESFAEIATMMTMTATASSQSPS